MMLHEEPVTGVSVVRGSVKPLRSGTRRFITRVLVRQVLRVYAHAFVEVSSERVVLVLTQVVAHRTYVDVVVPSIRSTRQLKPHALTHAVRAHVADPIVGGRGGPKGSWFHV